MNTTPDKKTVLVIGDWFLDEYWFVSRHHSDVSSHVGQAHYRAVSKPDFPVRDLCGAGLVARILYEQRKYDHDHSKTVKDYPDAEPQRKQNGEAPSFYSEKNLSKSQFCLVGIGRWSKRDDIVMPHFVHARCANEPKSDQSEPKPGQSETEPDQPSILLSTAFVRWKSEDCKKQVDIRLINIAQAKDTTTRCIRTFSFDGGQFTHLHRIDWEEPSNAPSDSNDSQSTIENFFNSFKESPAGKALEWHIVIDDHIKGGVSEALISRIFELAKDKQCLKFYIRTKDKRITGATHDEWPDWLRLIRRRCENEAGKNQISLLAVGPELSCRKYPTGRLLYNGEQLAAHTFELLELFSREGENFIKNVLLTSDHGELVLFSAAEGQQKRCT